MSGRIPQYFIDDLIGRIDIVDVIDQRVPLRQKGTNYLACCPFHDEKTPSFSVSQDKQFYHCFGCKASGNVISFLMEYDHMSFVDAIEELASRAGIPVPHEESTQDKKHQSDTKELYELLERCAEYYRQQLREHSQSQRAVEYLKQRGLSGEIARDYGVGYAPPGWDNVLKTLGVNDQLQKQLFKTGMLIKKDAGGFYDRFRDRIMFPIIDRRGRTIGFGGRVLGDDTPKYLNSPETPVFHKGSELYGLYQAKKALRNIDRLMVVEGYMDVVALAQYGIRYSVATLGTATTNDHLEQLFKMTPEVVFCFDGDRAGREAAWRSLETALPIMRDGRQIKYVFLPDGEDPDSLVRAQGKDALESLIEKAIPLSTFFYQSLSRQADINTEEGRARLVELARPLLARLPQGVFKELMVTRLAEVTHMEVEQLSGHMGSTATSPYQKILPKQTRTSADKEHRMPPMRKAIALLLHRPSLASRLEMTDELKTIDLPGMDLLLELLDLARENPQITTGRLLEHWRDQDAGKHLIKLSQWQPPPDDADWLLELKGALNHLFNEQRKQRDSAFINQAKIDKISTRDLTDEQIQELKNLTKPAKASE
ncbi:MAG: DNA primase [Gammaproteobacteria bacterium]|nr:DNA primase [Gammaproteobacteria bacterium]